MNRAEAPDSMVDTTSRGPLRELVVCSLEPWDEVWRRNQFLVSELLLRAPNLRVLFVEPPVDVLFDLTQGRRPPAPRIKKLRADGRLYAMRPLKPLPRLFGPISDWSLLWSALAVSRLLGFRSPTLWLNDVTYAPLISRTGWPTVYDVTDDWLLAPLSDRERTRLRVLDSLATTKADEVVVCSSTLESTRGRSRAVHLIANGVDREAFRLPRSRPADLPHAPVAAYVGTLHNSRLDVGLVVALARANRRISVVLVGPDALETSDRVQLTREPNVFLLGQRPHAEVPAYLQHADVVIVPHRVTPFTASLDPIKAYECLAVDTQTVATPVAGFRDLADHFTIAEASDFVDAVQAAIEHPVRRNPRVTPPTWAERAERFHAVLVSASVSDRPG